MTERVVLGGHARPPVPGSVLLGPAHPAEHVEITLVLRHRAALPCLATLPAHMTHAELADRHGPLRGDVDAVEAFARQHGLASRPGRGLATHVVSGPLSAIEAAFGVELVRHAHPAGGSYRAHAVDPTVPAYLAGIVEAVVGLDTRPAAKPHFRRHANPAAAPAAFTPVQVGQLYGFPGGIDGFPGGIGAGETIAILELGGGVTQADLADYFAGLDLAVPTVAVVPVAGGSDAPDGNPDGPDGEVMLDVEVAGAIAPGAALAVYFADNTDQGFLAGIGAAVQDTVHKPSVLSISWGGPEPGWSPATMLAFSREFHAAGALGITVLVAAGDDGSDDGVGDGKPHADYPASDPNVTACGGTRLVAGSGGIASETVWNNGAEGGATGGGYSAQFGRPSYQPAHLGDHRGLPDLAGNANPDTGYQVRVDGEDTVVGGTSAVAPLYAGLVAALNERLGRRLGFLNSALYGVLADVHAFRDVVEGSNGTYHAGLGWDPCSGWGSANGAKFLETLKG